MKTKITQRFANSGYLFILLSLFIVSCQVTPHRKQTSYLPDEPDYTDSTLWVINRSNHPVDVFYITPTCIFDWTDSVTQLPCHYYDVNRQIMKENFDYSLRLAASIFGRECNFYAPYYRQISLDSWLESEGIINQRFSTSMQDVSEAFSYYLTHYNQNHPFILAGYSQGGKAVIELIKELDQQNLSNMIAAYAVGYRITPEDLKHENITPARTADDQGVIISFNSVRGIEDLWDKVSKNSCTCINPVNWQTGTQKASLTKDITVEVDSTYQVLLVKGFNGGEIQIPLLKNTLTTGNYHLNELNLYEDNLRKNVAHRIAVYTQTKTHEEKSCF